MTRSSSLPQRLRAETAALHHHAEEQAGVPESVRTVADYIELLNCMLVFHRSSERALSQTRWSTEWTQLGVAIDDHTRSDVIGQDLLTLGAEPDDSPLLRLDFRSFAGALGCLYVVEGSSLGGRFIGPVIAEKLGAVPTAYYDGVGRDHPAPWRSVQAALGRYQSSELDQDAVVAGAVATFTLFGKILQSRLMAHESV